MSRLSDASDFTTPTRHLLIHQHMPGTQPDKLNNTFKNLSIIQDEKMNKEFTPYAPDNIDPAVDQASEQPSPLKQAHTPELTLVTTNPLPEGADSPVSVQHPDLNISRYLKAPRLANVKPNTVSYEQANARIHVKKTARHVLPVFWRLQCIAMTQDYTINEVDCRKPLKVNR